MMNSSLILRNDTRKRRKDNDRKPKRKNHRHLDITNQMKQSQYVIDSIFLKFQKTKDGLRSANQNHTKYRMNLVNRLKGTNLDKIPFSQFRKLEELKNKQKVWEKAHSSINKDLSINLNKRYQVSTFEEGYQNVETMEDFDDIICGKRKEIHVRDDHTKRMKEYNSQLFELINTPRNTVKTAIEGIKTKRKEEERANREKEIKMKQIEYHVEHEERVSQIINQCKGIPIAYQFIGMLYKTYVENEKMRKEKELREEQERYDQQLAQMGRFYLKNYSEMLKKLEKENRNEFDD